MLRIRIASSGYEGGPGLSTLYFGTAAPDAALALAVVNGVHSWWNDSMKGFFPSSVQLRISGDVDVVNAATGAVTDTLSVAFPAVIQSTGSESKAPASVAALMRLTTGTFIAGRRVRGRIFVSPLAAVAVDSDGRLSAGYVTSLNNALAAQEAALPAGALWGVWHRPKLGVGGLLCEITATSGAAKLAVLTSRRD